MSNVTYIYKLSVIHSNIHSIIKAAKLSSIFSIKASAIFLSKFLSINLKGFPTSNFLMGVLPSVSYSDEDRVASRPPVPPACSPTPIKPGGVRDHYHKARDPQNQTPCTIPPDPKPHTPHTEHPYTTYQIPNTLRPETL